MPPLHYTEQEWNEHIFDSMAYDQPDGFLETEYPEEAEEETYQTYDAWASSMNDQMNARHYQYQQPTPQELRDKEKQDRKDARAKRRDEKEREERDIKAYRERQRKVREREENTKGYIDGIKRFKRCFEAKSLVGFESVPWPIDMVPRKLRLIEAMLSEKSIIAFLGSIARDKALMKDQLLLWHPDKFIRYRSIIHESEWDQVLVYSTLVSKALTSIYNTI